MDKIKCLIVDDENVAQRIIAGYLKDLSGYEIVATCKNAMEAMNVLNENEVDLMFLDIEMPKLKGLDFLKTLSNPPAVIITTAHRNYALESYEHEILDYLLKPISFDRFIKAVNRYKKKKVTTEEIPTIPTTPTQKIIYIKSERKTIKLSMRDINYIEGMNNYVIFHTINNRHIVYRSITDLLTELDEHFVRVHKSYVVNTSKIVSFNKEEVAIGEKVIPIGKTYRHVVDQF